MFLIMIKGFSQDNCDDIIIRANNDYDKGLFREVISNLELCMKKDANEVTLWQSYKLLAMCQLQLNSPENARIAAEKMLEINPLYKPNVLNDPKEFIDLIKSITVIPRFSLTVSGIYGITNSSPQVINSFELTGKPKIFEGGTGFNAGIFIDYYFSKHIALQTGAFTTKYNYSFNYNQSDLGSNVTGKEHLNYFEIPVLVKYTIGSWPLRPYLQLGGYYGYLNTDYLDLTLTDADGSITKTKNNSIKDIRKPYNWGMLFGLGLSYKLRSGSLFLDYRLTKGVTNIYNTSINRYSNSHQDLMYNYYYIPDDIRLNNVIISVGYAFYVSYKVVRNQKYKFL